MRYALAIIFFALPMFGQTAAPPFDLNPDSIDWRWEPARDVRCRDGLNLPLFDLLPAHSVTRYVSPKPLEGTVPTERLRVGEPRSQQGPVDDPVKARRNCNDTDPRGIVTVVT